MSKGLGYTKAMPGLTVTSKRLVTSADDLTAQIDLGTEVRLHEGRCYKYVIFNAASTIGDVNMILMPDVTQTNLTAATSTTSVTVTDTGTFTASRYNGALEEYYYATNGGTGPGQIRRIISNTADALTIDAAPSTALDTTTDGVTFSPYRVTLTTAATNQAIGVGLHTATAGYFGWIQTKGVCPLVQFAGNVNAAAAHQIIIPSSTVGEATGRTAGGVLVAELEVGFGYGMYAYSTATADSRGIAAMLECRGVG